EARKFASYLDLSVAIGDKIRRGHDEKAEILEIIGDVEGKNVLIVDDFSISGGTLINIAEALKEKGANKVIACLSHILLDNEGIKKVENSPIELIISTDSVNNENILHSSKIKLISVAPLFAEAIQRIHNRTSVSPLFNEIPEKVIKNSIKE